MYKSSIENDIRMWEKNGFYFHFERDDVDKDKINYHTHGILHSRGKEDFLITQPIDPSLARIIFTELVSMLDNGFAITEGMIIEDFLGGITLEFSKPKNDDNDMILQVNVKRDGFRF